MEYKQVTETVWVSAQISEDDISDISKQGFKSIICNRPDDEVGAIHHEKLVKIAKKHGITFYYIPVSSNGIADGQPAKMAECIATAKTPILAYCRSGIRASNLTAAAMAERTNSVSTSAGHVVIVGGGAAGIATASSLFERSSAIQVTIIEPADVHYYQPGWTMVGAGVFSQEKTVKAMAGQIPNGVKWVKSPVREFKPEHNLVIAENGDEITYDQLVVCPGLKLDWGAIEGLEDTLGKNGVTSNYRFDLAPYTWKLVSEMKEGKAIFTQPPMPIKCAGAPQKALYLEIDINKVIVYNTLSINGNKGYQYESDQMLGGKPIASYDIKVNDKEKNKIYKIDVKGLWSNQTELRVNYDAHTKDKDVTHYMFVQPKSDNLFNTLADIWICEKQLINNWELKELKYSKAYVKTIL